MVLSDIRTVASFRPGSYQIHWRIEAKRKRRERSSRRNPYSQIAIDYGLIADNCSYQPGANWNPQTHPFPGRWNGCARYASKIM